MTAPASGVNLRPTPITLLTRACASSPRRQITAARFARIQRSSVGAVASRASSATRSPTAWLSRARPVPGLGQVFDVCAGQYFTCALVAHGGVRRFGTGGQGQLGGGNVTSLDVSSRGGVAPSRDPGGLPLPDGLRGHGERRLLLGRQHLRPAGRPDADVLGVSDRGAVAVAAHLTQAPASHELPRRRRPASRPPSSVTELDGLNSRGFEPSQLATNVVGSQGVSGACVQPIRLARNRDRRCRRRTAFAARGSRSRSRTPAPRGQTPSRRRHTGWGTRSGLHMLFPAGAPGAQEHQRCEQEKLIH